MSKQPSTGALGPYIRRKRQELHIGLREMARRIGLSPTHLSRAERGDFRPGREAIVKIAHQLKEDADLLLALNLRVAPDLEEIIRKKPVATAELIRSLDGLSENEIRMIAGEIRSGVRPAATNKAKK